MARAVAPGVQVVSLETAEGKAGVIAGDSLVLAVDAGVDPVEGGAVREAARAFGRPHIALVLTHGHYDHALGTPAFRGDRIVAHEAVAPHMRTQLEAWAQRWSTTPAVVEESLEWPSETFAGDIELDLGGRSVQLIDSPGHAPGSVCVLDLDQGVLFGGDTIVTAIPPDFWDGDGRVLAATLRRLQELEADTLVPGHGAVVQGRRAVSDAIDWSATYLERCLAVVDAHASEGADAIIAAAPYDDYIGARLPRDRMRMPWRHERTIRRLVVLRDGSRAITSN